MSLLPDRARRPQMTKRRLPIWTDGTAEEEELSPAARTHGRLEALSGHVLDGVRQVAGEGDRLFVLAINGVGTGLQRAQTGISGVSRRVSFERVATRLGLRRDQSTRERVRQVLIAEVARAPIAVTPEEFELFADKMALLFELVLMGVVSVEDIVLEEGCEPDAPPAGVAPDHA